MVLGCPFLVTWKTSLYSTEKVWGHLKKGERAGKRRYTVQYNVIDCSERKKLLTLSVVGVDIAPVVSREGAPPSFYGTAACLRVSLYGTKNMEVEN